MKEIRIRNAKLLPKVMSNKEEPASR